MAESGEERRERESERVSDREWRGMCESEREREALDLIYF